MAQSVSAIVARSAEVDETMAKAFDARREKIAEMARQRVDPNAVRVDRPQQAAKVESPRPVTNVAETVASPPNLTPQLRSMLSAPPQPAFSPAAGQSSTVLIGQLLDALRQYERTG